MQRYILTGAPGAGKTTLIRALADRGHPVVEEAATDVVAQYLERGVAAPHLEPDFINQIVRLQQSRREASTMGAVQVHDRSPICTLALSLFLGRETPPILAAELARIDRERPYQRQVFFVETLGYIVNTPVRRITYEDTLAFGVVHEQVYRDLGYELVQIAPGTAEERALAVENAIARLAA